MWCTGQTIGEQRAMRRLVDTALVAGIVACAIGISGCMSPSPDDPPPALPGVVNNIRFVPLADQPKVCAHPNSLWSHACILSATGQIIMPLPQDFPDDPYAQLWLWELAHRQQGWPDPPEISAQLHRDAMEAR
jgi:hypothetical protein